MILDSVNGPYSRNRGHINLTAATVLVSIALTCFGCDQQRQAGGGQNFPDEVPKQNVAVTDLSASIKSFCADCHHFPPPDTFAKHSWREEVDQGFQFYLTSGRTDLNAPPFEATVDWFEERAPQSLPFPREDVQPSRHFERLEFTWGGTEPLVAVSSFLPTLQQPENLIVTDMHTGQLWNATLLDRDVGAESVSTFANPCRAIWSDLNQDGAPELLVTDLGSFMPKDHREGGVWWVNRGSEGHYGEPKLIVEDVGRVCDVSVLDVDRDGDQDLLVAEFGWQETGAIRLYKNEGVSDDVPKFQMQVVDRRHGAIDVPVVDLNDDGWSDFIALVSQEFEAVDAFINDKEGGFSRHELFRAPHPAFGSSSIHCVDIEGDGDIDVLYSNGDSLDSTVVKPCHGLWLLKNTGFEGTTDAATGPVLPKPKRICNFETKRLVSLPGAYDVTSADFDRDGDVDVAAVSLVPESEHSAHPDVPFPGVIWLEQTARGEFTQHIIQSERGEFATLLATDLNSDGRMDLLTARCSFTGVKSRKLIGFVNQTENLDSAANDSLHPSEHNVAATAK